MTTDRRIFWGAAVAAILGSLAIVALSAFGQDISTARANRIAVEAKSAPALPASDTLEFDQAAKVSTGQVFQGLNTKLSQPYTSGSHPLNSVLYAYGEGSNWHDPFTHGPGKAQITTAVAPNIPVGSVIYVWKYNSHPTGQQPCQRRIVTARSGNTLTLDQLIDSTYDRVKYFTIAASPIANDIESAVTYVNVSGGARNFPPGSTVIVTSGPSWGLELSGEIRRVASVNGNTVYLDRAVTRDYVNGVLARLNTIDNVTIRDCVISQPVNTLAESLFVKFVTGWRFERCVFGRVALNGCRDMQFIDCKFLGRVQLNTSQDVKFTRCQMQSVSFEEDSRDNVIDGCTIGPAPANVNCIASTVGSEYLTVRNTSLMGAGPGGCQIYGGGTGCAFLNVRMYSKVSPCWVSGAGLRFDTVLGEADINFTGAPTPSLTRVWTSNLKVWE